MFWLRLSFDNGAVAEPRYVITTHDTFSSTVVEPRQLTLNDYCQLNLPAIRGDLNSAMLLTEYF